MTHITTVTTMTSREIAELTGKAHMHVMRDLKTLQEQLGDDFKGCIQVWIHPQNKQTYEEFVLDKDTTLTLLTGYDAVARMKVIKRWQELEAKQATPALPENPLIAGLVTALYKVDELEREQAAIKNKVLELEAKVQDAESDFYTVAGYAALKGIKMPSAQANGIGRKAVAASKELGIPVSKQKSSRYGTVNAYHMDVLEELFQSI